MKRNKQRRRNDYDNTGIIAGERQVPMRSSYDIRTGLVVPDSPDGTWDQAGFLDALDKEFDSSLGRNTVPTMAQQSSGWQGATTNYVRCDHQQEQIQIGDNVILVTAAHDVTERELNQMRVGQRDLIKPDLGVYLTSEWARLMKAAKPLPIDPGLPTLELCGTVPTGLESLAADIQKRRADYAAAKAEADKLPDSIRWPYILIGWPDQGAIPTEVAEEVVTFMLAQMAAGKVIDTGCAGAHGRTGTLLAMLLIDAESLDPETAIREVRKRHCKKAIESDRQVRAIFSYGGKIATPEEVKRLG